MESVKIQNKIKLLFKKVTEPNYVLDNYYADGLMNKLSKCSDPGKSIKLILWRYLYKVKKQYLFFIKIILKTFSRACIYINKIRMNVFVKKCQLF